MTTILRAMPYCLIGFKFPVLYKRDMPGEEIFFTQSQRLLPGMTSYAFSIDRPLPESLHQKSLKRHKWGAILTRTHLVPGEQVFQETEQKITARIINPFGYISNEEGKGKPSWTTMIYCADKIIADPDSLDNKRCLENFRLELMDQKTFGISAVYGQQHEPVPRLSFSIFQCNMLGNFVWALERRIPLFPTLSPLASKDQNIILTAQLQNYTEPVPGHPDNRRPVNHFSYFFSPPDRKNHIATGQTYFALHLYDEDAPDEPLARFSFLFDPDNYVLREMLHQLQLDEPGQKAREWTF